MHVGGICNCDAEKEKKENELGIVDFLALMEYI